MENRLREALRYKTEWKIEKYESEQAFKKGKAYDIVDIKGNLLLNEGINNLLTLAAGGVATPYDNTNARLGVGDSNTAEAAAQTDLQASSNKLYKAMDVSYPTYGTSQQIVFRSTFGSSEANFAWNEFSVDNGNSANKNLNRKVSAQGTKVSGQVWVLTLTITLS